MPVYQLIEDPVFPHPSVAEADGLLAFGGSLSPEWLVTAYSQGIFPWYSEGQPVLWWSPDPRMVLFPDEFKRHKNLRRVVEQQKFEVRFDHDFPAVIELCSRVPRKGQFDTWITDDMKKAYVNLHRLGYCHSVETYYNGKLAGGLYGVSLGGTFFGESMFHLVTDASKVALWHLVDFCLSNQFDMIDVQQETSHLKSLGATPLPRKDFLTLLQKSMTKPTIKGKWHCG